MMADKPVMKNTIQVDESTKPCGVIHFFCPEDRVEDISIYGKTKPYENKEGFITLMVDPRYEFQEVLDYIKFLRLDKDVDYGNIDHLLSDSVFQELIDSFVEKVEDDESKLSDYERGKQDGYMEIAHAFRIKYFEAMKKLPSIDSGIEGWDIPEEWEVDQE